MHEPYLNLLSRGAASLSSTSLFLNVLVVSGGFRLLNHFSCIFIGNPQAIDKLPLIPDVFELVGIVFSGVTSYLTSVGFRLVMTTDCHDLVDHSQYRCIAIIYDVLLVTNLVMIT